MDTGPSRKTFARISPGLVRFQDRCKGDAGKLIKLHEHFPSEETDFLDITLQRLALLSASSPVSYSREPF